MEMVTVSALSSFQSLPPEATALREAFKRWQCRVRQMAMRTEQGRPGDAITPSVHLEDRAQPFGHVITVMSKSGPYSVLPELQHLGKSTFDPAQRRDKALTFFQASYYQKHREFDDMLTATFQARSSGAIAIAKASPVRLKFDAFNQHFDLACQVRQLTEKHPLHQATWWHNFLFNPQLEPDCIILGFAPDWTESLAHPPIGGGH